MTKPFWKTIFEPLKHLCLGNPLQRVPLFTPKAGWRRAENFVRLWLSDDGRTELRRILCQALLNRKNLSLIGQSTRYGTPTSNSFDIRRAHTANQLPKGEEVLSGGNAAT